MKHRLLIISVCLFLAAPVRAGDNVEEIDSYRPLQSSALLLVPREKGVAQGTGWVADRANRLLVTNHHVAHSSDNVQAIFPVYNTATGRVFASRTYYLTKAPRIRGQVIEWDAKKDLAVVELSSIPDNLPELTLAAQSASAGDAAFAVGNPADDVRVWISAPGKVKQVKPLPIRFESGHELKAQICEIEALAPVAPGVSGGPIVNDKSEIIAVSAAGRPQSNRSLLGIDVSEVRVVLGRAYRNKGTSFIKQKNYDQAIAWCSKAIQVNPADALAFNERGAAYTFQDKFDDAIKDFNACVKLDAKSSKAFRNRGSAFFYKGNYQQAVDDCTQAIKLQPDFALAYKCRAKAYAKLKEDQLAQFDQAKALQLDPLQN